MKTLETKRLILRDWKREDVTDLYAYASSPKAGPMAGWKPHKTLEESKEILSLFIKEKETLAIELKSTHKVIGSVGLHHRTYAEFGDILELGYVLSENYWGQGIMPEAVQAVLSYAFMDCGHDRIFVAHFSNNNQSKRVIEKSGFQFLKKLSTNRKDSSGNFIDDYFYELTKEKYIKLLKSQESTRS